MRILLLIHNYLPETGPPQLRWAGLVREFRAKGHQVHVITPPPHYPSGRAMPETGPHPVGAVEEGCFGETVHRVAWRPTDGSALSELIDQGLFTLHATVTAWRRRHEIAADVVVATAPALPTLAAGWATSRLLGSPLVLEMRDAWPDLAADASNAGTSWKQRVRRLGVSAAARGVHALQHRADLLVATTTSFTGVLRQRGMERVVTVRNAHHPLPGWTDSPPREKGAGLNVVYVGTVGRAQHLETAVLAVAAAREAGADVRMRVVGTGSRIAPLRALVERLDVPVEVPGPVPRAQVREHYQWADTLLVSLRDWRPLAWTVPSKLYEALALGLHISGMVRGESKDIIERTRAGFTVRPGDHRALADAWVRLAEHCPQPDREAMRDWVRTHATEEGTATAYLDELTRLLDDSTSRPVRDLRVLAQRTGHLAAAAGALGAMARDDLPWLTVQAGRRLPSSVRSRVGRWATRGRDGLLGVWGELLVDRPDRARERLAALDGEGRLAGALAVHAGAEPGPGAGDAHRARWAWQVGDLTTAAHLAREPGMPARLRHKLEGDIEALTGGPRPLPPVTRTWTPGREPRVLHVLTNSLPWTRSGYTLRTHAILTAQRDAGVTVAAMTRPAYPVSVGRVTAAPVDTVDGIDYYRCVPRGLPPGEAQRADVWAEHLVRLAERHRATHLHSTTHYPNALAAQAAAHALDLPWVHEVRGQLERTWASGRVRHGDADPYASERFRAWRVREAELAAAADHVFTLSQVMRSDLADRGVDPSRVTVVPNGIDAALLDRHTAPADARRSLGLPAEGLWVGAVTSVVHYEGLSGLLDAVALARSSGVDVRAAIVGDGLAWPDLQRQVAELGLQDVVHLPGKLARPLALTWLEALDVVAVPREDYEVTRLVPPLKVAEAMGVGRPVVASDLPALAELVTHHESGLLVPPEDPAALAQALVTLAEDPGLRDRLTAAGKQVAAGLTWQELAHTYRGVYEKVSAVAGSLGPSGKM